MLILYAKVLKGAWRLTALVYFSRWQMPFCVLHKLTKFACSLYFFHRQPFFAFNRTEELLGTGTLVVWWGRDEGCSEDHSHHPKLPLFRWRKEVAPEPWICFAWGMVRTVWVSHRRWAMLKNFPELCFQSAHSYLHGGQIGSWCSYFKSSTSCWLLVVWSWNLIPLHFSFGGEKKELRWWE